MTSIFRALHLTIGGNPSCDLVGRRIVFGAHSFVNHKKRIGTGEYINTSYNRCGGNLRTVTTPISPSRHNMLMPSNLKSTFRRRSIFSTATRNKTIYSTIQILKKRAVSFSTIGRRPAGKKIQSFLLTPRVIPIPRWITPNAVTVTLSEVCGHLSFVLVFLSYAVDDFLLLRIVAVAGSTSMLFFTYFHPHGRVLWLPFKWNVLFIAVNMYRIFKTVFEHYLASQMSPDILHLRHDHFQVIELNDFAKLVNIGEIEELEIGDVLFEQGEAHPFVRVVIEGELDVLRDGVLTYSLEDGNFISESGMHAGLMLPGSVEASGTVIATRASSTTGKIRCIKWERADLVKLLQKCKPLSRSFQSVLSWDVVSKLKSQRLLLAEGAINSPGRWTGKRMDQSYFRYLAILHNIIARKRDLHANKEELQMYRTIHHIDDEHHKQALETCGWTTEEFDTGKEGISNLDNDDDWSTNKNLQEKLLHFLNLA